jgi:hypothetical protein
MWVLVGGCDFPLESLSCKKRRLLPLAMFEEVAMCEEGGYFLTHSYMCEEGGYFLTHEEELCVRRAATSSHT